MYSGFFICTLEFFQLFCSSRYSLQKIDVYGDFGDFLGVITFHLRGIDQGRSQRPIIQYQYRSIEKHENRSIIHQLH